MGYELPLGFWDPLVLVWLGDLVFLFVELFLLNWFDFGGRLAGLFVVALFPPTT